MVFPKERFEKEAVQSSIATYLSVKGLPKTPEELFEGWGKLRVLNKINLNCNCSEYFKMNRCKHLAALLISQDQLKELEVCGNQKRGRKSKIYKSLIK